MIVQRSGLRGIAFILSYLTLLVFLLPSTSLAHRSGCHRWHSCPSDTGSYTCGDLGYCSQCPDNQYCKAGQPISQSSPPVRSTPGGRIGEGKGVPPLTKSSCPASHPIKGNLSTRTGECIYHVPGGAYYGRTNPERCFIDEKEAVEAGCRKSKR